MDIIGSSILFFQPLEKSWHKKCDIRKHVTLASVKIVLKIIIFRKKGLESYWSQFVFALVQGKSGYTKWGTFISRLYQSMKWTTYKSTYQFHFKVALPRPTFIKTFELLEDKLNTFPLPQATNPIVFVVMRGQKWEGDVYSDHTSISWETEGDRVKSFPLVGESFVCVFYRKLRSNQS